MPLRMPRYGLLRFARNDEVAKWVRHNNPTGKSAKTCPSLLRKIFRFRRRANQGHYSARPARQEGRCATSRNARWDAVDAEVTETKVAQADGEVVGFRRRDAGVKSCGTTRKAMVARKPVHQGEHEVSRKTIAQGRPGCLRRTCMLVCAFVCAICTRDRGCGVHPAFPAPSSLEEG